MNLYEFSLSNGFDGTGIHHDTPKSSQTYADDYLWRVVTLKMVPLLPAVSF